MRERMRRIGLGYEPFSFARLDPAVQQALSEARPTVQARRIVTSARLGTSVNGWSTIVHGLGTYGTDYNKRAAIAYVGLGATIHRKKCFTLLRYPTPRANLLYRINGMSCNLTKPSCLPFTPFGR
jgi:hypothetical protein